MIVRFKACRFSHHESSNASCTGEYRYQYRRMEMEEEMTLFEADITFKVIVKAVSAEKAQETLENAHELSFEGAEYRLADVPEVNVYCEYSPDSYGEE